MGCASLLTVLPSIKNARNVLWSIHMFELKSRCFYHSWITMCFTVQELYKKMLYSRIRSFQQHLFLPHSKQGNSASSAKCYRCTLSTHIFANKWLKNGWQKICICVRLYLIPPDGASTLPVHKGDLKFRQISRTKIERMLF